MSKNKEGQYEQPLYGPSPYLDKLNRYWDWVQSPVIWFRKSVVEPNRLEYPYYHQKFQRVKTIEKCNIEDQMCIYEANQQFLRDRRVDNEIVRLLRNRMEDCYREEYPDHLPRCNQLKEEYEDTAANWFTKYGDLGASAKVQTAFMKQKHRLLWERKHGRIGTGMKADPFEVKEADAY